MDLEIFVEGTHLHTRTHTKKDTDRNGYIPVKSSHRAKWLWLNGIPKGQIMHIRRNCNSMQDFNKQTELLMDRFEEKGYKRKTLNKVKEQVKNMNREELLETKTREGNPY